jgi:hypothetical protein
MWMPAPVTVRPADPLGDSPAHPQRRASVPAVSRRTRRRVIEGLRSVARRSRQEGSRRNYDVLLCHIQTIDATLKEP